MTDTDDTTDYRGPKIPAEVGEALATALALKEKLETLDEWADSVPAVTIVAPLEETLHNARVLVNSAR